MIRTNTERGKLYQEVGLRPLQPQLPPSVPKIAREAGSRFGFCSSKSTFVKLSCQDLEFGQIVKGKGIRRFQNRTLGPPSQKKMIRLRQNHHFFGGASDLFQNSQIHPKKDRAPPGFAYAPVLRTKPFRSLAQGGSF